MRTLIVYSTKYGTTARCARMLAERIRGGADPADLADTPTPSLAGYDTVLIGGAIHAGRIRPAVRRFCDRARSALLARRVGLFICCLYTGERAQAQLDEAFPAWLSGHAFARRALGGAVRMSALGPVDRFLFRKITGMSEDIERIDDAAITALAEAAAGGAPG